jgi:hypothetical protein
MAREAIILHGKKIGRLRASWLLFKESWRFLRADPELLWVPVITFFINLFLLSFLLGAFVLGTIGNLEAWLEEGMNSVKFLLVFGIYVVSAFSVALAQAAISHIVFVRAEGGDATLKQGMQEAVRHSQSLLIWAVIAGTVSVLIRVFVEKSPLFGKILVSLLGFAWSVLTYFVVPAIVLGKKEPIIAIKHSGALFVQTWGETVVSNVTLSLVFIMAHIVAFTTFFGLVVFGMVLNSLVFILLAVTLIMVWVVASTIISQVLTAVLKTLLYVYAMKHPIKNFDVELLEKMLVVNKTVPSPQAPAPSTV